MQLQQDTIKYCKQIGILPGEEPRLIFNTKKMNELDLKHSDVQSRKAVCQGYLGMCFMSVFVFFIGSDS